MHSLNSSSSCDSFLGRQSTGQKRERYEHGQDCKEESEAGTQGEGEDCREALGKRPPQNDCEAVDCSQVEGSSPEGRLTAAVTIDAHDRPDDLSGHPADAFLAISKSMQEMRIDFRAEKTRGPTSDCTRRRFSMPIRSGADEESFIQKYKMVP